MALDAEAPRSLRIASFRTDPNELAALTQNVFSERFDLNQQGTLEQFSAYIKKARAEDPEGENQLYPQWQQMQYLYSMFAAHHEALENDRYDGLTWQTLETTIKEIYNNKKA